MSFRSTTNGPYITGEIGIIHRANDVDVMKTVVVVPYRKARVGDVSVQVAVAVDVDEGDVAAVAPQ